MFANETVAPKIEVREVNSSLTSFYIRFIGSYFLDSKFTKTLKRVFAKADKTKQIVISCITEPNLIITVPSENAINIFEFLHGLCADTGFSARRLILLTSNLYASQSYKLWAKFKNVVPEVNVVDQQSFYWIERVIDKGHRYIAETIPTKHFTCFIGRPRLQKNAFVEWYVENIQDTVNEEKMRCTFLYKNVRGAWFDDNRDKINRLPGKVEDNDGDHTNAFLFGDPNKFDRAMLSGLIDITVDFTEEENFVSIEDFAKFKNSHPWWIEDTISEKTFKCVLLKKPFIRLGNAQSLEKFKSWGFKTFDNVLFDESYDKIPSLDQRTKCIIEQVEKYLALDFDEMQQKVNTKEVTDILEHNYKLAYEILNNRKDIIHV